MLISNPFAGYVVSRANRNAVSSSGGLTRRLSPGPRYWVHPDAGNPSLRSYLMPVKPDHRTTVAVLVSRRRRDP